MKENKLPNSIVRVFSQETDRRLIMFVSYVGMNSKFQLRENTGLTFDWEKCVLCQRDTKETLLCPENSLRVFDGAGYRSLADNLVEFKKIGQLPAHVNFERLDGGVGLYENFLLDCAKFHKN